MGEGVFSRGVSAQGGLPRGDACLGVSARGVSAQGAADPPVNRMTDRCKNITLP